MTFTTNSVTDRLEGFARARGMDLGIVVSEGNSAGRFFVTVNDGRALSRWIALGWTRAEAEDALQRRAAGIDPAPSATGYTFQQ